ncbi:MAG: Rne/Rng family ribonuclease [Terrimesophilobacter sp.]
MVENTNNNNGENTDGVKKRRLFGSHRQPKQVASQQQELDIPASAAQPDQPAEPDVRAAVTGATDAHEPSAGTSTSTSAPSKAAPSTAVSSTAAPSKSAPSKLAPSKAAASTASSSESGLAEAASEAASEAAVAAPAAKTRARRAPATRAKKTETSAESSDTASAESEAPEAPAEPETAPARASLMSPLFQAPDLSAFPPRRGERGRGDHDRGDHDNGHDNGHDDNGRDRERHDDETSTVRRRARRRSGDEDQSGEDTPPGTVIKVRTPRKQHEPSNEPQKVRGSTRLEAKKQRRRDGRDAGRRRSVITESEFLARRESVDRAMVVRSKADRIQIAVLEDGVLVEHYVAKAAEASLIGNVYLGRVQNVLPSMEAAFVDIGRGRNAVLYSGEVDWEAAAADHKGGSQARRIELALKPGDKVLVQVSKDPVGHKGARLTSQVSLPGRYLVYVPNGSMNGISRKLPDTERARLKKILKEVLPDNVGVIVRTAAEGATEEQLTLDVNRLTAQWAEISHALESVQAPALLHSEPDLLVKIVRDVFNEDFHRLVIEGEDAEATILKYLGQVAPDLIDRIERYDGADSFDEFRISEQIEKALDRKVWLPSGGSLVIDRTEAMTVIDVNTGKFVGSGGNLEETVTKNNLEAAEEIVRQLRLRDIGGIIVVDFIDMVLESNRDLVLRRLVECLSRDRTKHQVAEVTSLGLIQMTRKKLGLGLVESFSEPCEYCAGRGIIIHHDPVTRHRQTAQPEIRRGRGKGGDSGRSSSGNGTASKNGAGTGVVMHAITEDVKSALAQIAASTIVPTAETSEQQAAHQAGQQGPAAASEPDSAARRGSESAPDSAAVQLPDAARDAVTSDAPETLAETASVAAAEAAIAILDIPVKKSSRPQRRISTKDAEDILDSVLDALPEPKQPGQGRSRRPRRASSAGSTVTTTTTPSDQPS